MIEGYIPEKVIYVCGAPEEISVAWDDIHGKKLVERTVIPCYPVASGSAETLNTARKWASWRTVDGKVCESERDNTPMGLSICSLEVRERGGRAYKVITDEGYFFDLREDVLLESLLSSGIRNGRMQSEFIWAKIGSQMKLVRVGSMLHSAVKVAGMRRSTAKLKTAALEAGGIYRNIKGHSFLFLGWVSTVVFEHSKKTPPLSASDCNDAAERMIMSKHPKMLLTLSLPDIHLNRLHGSASAWLEDVIALKEHHYSSYLKIQKSLSVMEKAGQVDIPANIVDRCSEAGLKALQATHPDLGVMTDVMAANIAYYSALINVRPVSEDSEIASGFVPYFSVIAPLLQA